MKSMVKDAVKTETKMVGESDISDFGVPKIMVLGCGGAGCNSVCLLYTSDAADDLLCVDLGGRRVIKKKKALH